LHNKPKAEVHPGQKLTGTKEEEEEEEEKKKKKKITSLQDYSSLQYSLSIDTENKCRFCIRCVK
jgi:hypothetical protein